MKKNIQNISCGSNGESYFSFLKLGKSCYFIIERKGKIIAAGCSILRPLLKPIMILMITGIYVTLKLLKNYRKIKF